MAGTCRQKKLRHIRRLIPFALLYIQRAPCSLHPLLTTPISMFRQPRPPDPDQDLVTRAQQGDTRAFDALILKYGDKLFGLVYNMTSHKEDTHDLLQEIFARAYQSLGKFKGNSAFYTWIYQIAVNLTLNFLKKRKRRTSLSLNDMESSVQQDPGLIDTANEANPEKQTNLNELQQKLNEALRKLSDPHRMVVTMFDIQGMSHADIAKVLDTSEGTIRSRLHYAHLQLQSALQDSWEERF
jgi:RNA polymerase sigma factor (sigma-70 family)